MAQIIGGSLKQKKIIKAMQVSAVLPAFFVMFMYLIVYKVFEQDWVFFTHLENFGVKNDTGIIDQGLWDNLIAIGDRLFFVIVYFTPVFIIQFMRLKNVIGLQEEGTLLRGIEVIDGREDFIKKITKEAKKNAEKLEKGLGKKLPAFYTPRLHLTAENIPFFYDRETKSTIIIGSAGSGKTLAFFDYISKFLAWDEEHNKQHFWVVYDRKHDFWVKMYREGKDFLFLPNDVKTLKWNWFSEFLEITIIFTNKKTGEIFKVKCKSIREAKDLYYKKVPDYISVNMEKKINNAELTNLLLAFIPKAQEASSETWVAKGRTAMEAAFISVAMQNEFPSPADFIDFINQYNTREKFVERVLELNYALKYRAISIESVIGGLDDSTEAGVNGFENFQSKVKELNKTAYYYHADECDFELAQIHEGMKMTHYDKRLFLCQDPENETEYSTVFSALLELLAKKIINLPSDLDRRITFLLDEVASLGYMPSVLNDLPEQARSRGNNMIVGLQSLSRFSEIYGDKGMDSILANIQNRTIMSIQDNFTLEWVMKNLGENEYEVEAESFSTENNSTNMSMSRQKRAVLTVSQLTGLAPAEGYFKLGSYIKKTYFPVDSMPKITKYEINENLPSILNIDFEEEDEVNHIVRRDKIANAVIWLLNNTNKPINVKNVSKQADMSELKTKAILEEFTEEKRQVEEAVMQLQFGGFSNQSKAFKIEALKKITGLNWYQIEPFVPKSFFAVEVKKEPIKEVKVEETFEEEKYSYEDLGDDVLEEAGGTW